MKLIVSAANAYSIDIPGVFRQDTAAVFWLAANRMKADALNGNNFEAHPEISLTKTAGRYGYERGAPMPWILPLLRDVMGLMPREFAEWDRSTPLTGAEFVLHAIAHAIENHDI